MLISNYITPVLFTDPHGESVLGVFIVLGLLFLLSGCTSGSAQESDSTDIIKPANSIENAHELTSYNDVDDLTERERLINDELWRLAHYWAKEVVTKTKLQGDSIEVLRKVDSVMTLSTGQLNTWTQEFVIDKFSATSVTDYLADFPAAMYNDYIHTGVHAQLLALYGPEGEDYWRNYQMYYTYWLWRYTNEK